MLEQKLKQWFGFSTFKTGQKEVIELLDEKHNILRPLNYPKEVPGVGSVIIELSGQTKICVLNLVGRVFMQAVECPFRISREEIDNMRKVTPNIFVDIHAEATSEKIALGWYLDGLVTAVMGTHTHVQTADEKILPMGTAYITDVGMCGYKDGVLGFAPEEVINKFLTNRKTRFQPPQNGTAVLQAILFTVNGLTGKAHDIQRLERVIY